jgi:hypothetical protein
MHPIPTRRDTPGPSPRHQGMAANDAGLFPAQNPGPGGGRDVDDTTHLLAKTAGCKARVASPFQRFAE